MSIAAGEFSRWLRNTRNSLRGQASISVPCGDCRACCESSYIIPVSTKERKTISKIPNEMILEIPGLSEGVQCIEYDKSGRCRMLIDNDCSIYEDRPQVCRSYDCRIFAATGLLPGDENKESIASQIRRWRFEFPTTLDQDQYQAVYAAAKFLKEHADHFPAEFIPHNPMQLAALAIKVSPVFLRNTTIDGKIFSKARVLKTIKQIIKEFSNFEIRQVVVSVRSYIPKN